MKRKFSFWMLAALTVATAAAQDPPSRVARIAFMTGQVSFEPATVDQWAPASLNYPMTTGDNLYSDNDSRAVLRIGQNSIRLDAGTNFQFVNLSDNVVQVSINSGALSLRVRHLFPNESWEVDTPNGAVTLLREGEYRIDCDSNRNATMATIRRGDVEVTANSQSFPVHASQTAYFDASGQQPQIGEANPDDPFDAFAYNRDRLEDVPPPQYVSADMVGYEDLNANGTWQADAEYGPAWYPNVAAGWVPYQTGQWAWVEPWGWTWVDQEPWGFAPFHYGRWAFVGERWGWFPGPVVARPYYAPALVAFVGGGGFGISVGGGGGGGGLVGWFPLGPRDPFIPAYHVSDIYVRQVNVTNIRVTNINYTNINVQNINYMNRGVAGAVVAVPRTTFASAQPVQRAEVRVSPEQLRGASVVGMAPTVIPQRASVLATSRPAGRVAAPPANIANRAVVAKLTPPPAPVSFAAKQQILQQHPGVPVAPQQLQTIRQQQPAAAPARVQVRPMNTAQVRPVTPAARPASAPGFGQPAARAPQPAPAAVPPGRFGQPTPAPSQARPLTPAPAPAQTRPFQPAPVPNQVRPQPAPNYPPARPAENAPSAARPPATPAPAPARETPQQYRAPAPAQQRPATPTREASPTPQSRPAAPAVQPQRQPPPPARPAPQAAPQRTAPPRPAPPPKKEEEKKDEKKQ